MSSDGGSLGVVKWFNARKGYGFLTPQGRVEDSATVVAAIVAKDRRSQTGCTLQIPRVVGMQGSGPRSTDVFVHRSALAGRVLLVEGDEVEYSVGERRGREVATNVRPASGDGVQVHCREWQSKDQGQITSLHEEWFPIRYPDEYWRRACAEHRSLEGWALLTLARVLPKDPAHIIGCVSAVLMKLGRCPDIDSSAIWGHCTHTLYIKTLGVRAEHRRRGHALELVRACELYAREASSGVLVCGAVWLHVLASNTKAMKLYELSGFLRHKALPGFYNINGEMVDAWLMLKPTHES